MPLSGKSRSAASSVIRSLIRASAPGPRPAPGTMKPCLMKDEAYSLMLRMVRSDARMLKSGKILAEPASGRSALPPSGA